jgi:hypothetical protein
VCFYRRINNHHSPRAASARVSGASSNRKSQPVRTRPNKDLISIPCHTHTLAPCSSASPCSRSILGISAYRIYLTWPFFIGRYGYSSNAIVTGLAQIISTCSFFLLPTLTYSNISQKPHIILSLHRHHMQRGQAEIFPTLRKFASSFSFVIPPSDVFFSAKHLPLREQPVCTRSGNHQQSVTSFFYKRT